jgi:uncharacterized membrane protein (UPF0136 family)
MRAPLALASLRRDLIGESHMTNKLTNLQWIGVGGFIAVIVSMFLTYNNPDGYEAESLFKSISKSPDEGGLGLAFWAYVVLALAAVGAWMVYAKQKSFAVLLAGLVSGFVAFFFVYNTFNDGGIGLGVALSVLGAIAASVAAMMLSKSDA